MYQDEFDKEGKYYQSLSMDEKLKLSDEYLVAKKLNPDLSWLEFLRNKMEGK